MECNLGESLKCITEDEDGFREQDNEIRRLEWAPVRNRLETEVNGQLLL